VREGALYGGLPYLAFGQGPPLVVLAGLTPEHVNPAGMTRRWQVGKLSSLGDRFTVHLVNRKPGLRPGSTIRDLAGHYADAIEHDFGGPVLVDGESTGGSIAQQLAIDRPDLVRRLVLADSACRLSERGRAGQQAQARLIATGRPRRAYAAVGPLLAASALGGHAMTVLMWLLGGWIAPRDPSDLLITIAAEDAFDSSAELHRIAAPTLVIGGERDAFYSAELFRETADRVPDARLRLYPRKGHGIGLMHRPAVEEIGRFLGSDIPVP
jgi:pimeloyl-ACP methyl ester carboxylesterase